MSCVIIFIVRTLLLSQQHAVTHGICDDIDEHLCEIMIKHDINLINIDNQNISTVVYNIYSGKTICLTSGTRCNKLIILYLILFLIIYSKVWSWWYSILTI